MKKSINVSDAMVLSKMSERYYTQTEADGVIKDLALSDGSGFRGRKHVRFYTQLTLTTKHGCLIN